MHYTPRVIAHPVWLFASANVPYDASTNDVTIGTSPLIHNVRFIFLVPLIGGNFEVRWVYPSLQDSHIFRGKMRILSFENSPRLIMYERCGISKKHEGYILKLMKV